MFFRIAGYCAFGLLYIGILIQSWKIISQKTSLSISLWEIFLRLIASTLLLGKMISVGDVLLVVGQGVWVMLYIFYICVVIFFKKKSR